jgi:LacI family transcriptional regulator
MLEHRVGGIILLAVPGSPSEPINRICNLGIPIVLVGRKLPTTKCDYVGVDNVRGGQIAIEHLISRGHHRIAFVGGSSQLSSWRERKQGYDTALRRAGLPIDPTMVIESPSTRQGGVDAIQQLLNRPKPPTAAFCYNDTIAIGAMMKMKDMGLIPGYDISIVGFDDIPEATIFTPKLTTVSSSIRLMGIHTARLLNARMEKKLKPEPQNIILEPKLIVRDSCSHSTDSLADGYTSKKDSFTAN